MAEHTPLFRSAALTAQRNQGLGSIVLARPLSFAVLSATFGAIACGLLALAYFGRYTAHQTVQGRVTPEHGVIEVTSPQSGTLSEQHVQEGQHVTAGAVLYVVSSERHSSASGATQEAIGGQLHRRRSSLALQIESTRRLEAAERASLSQRLRTLQDETRALGETIAAQRERVALAAAGAERFDRVRAQGYVSEEQWTVKQGEWLEQRARLQSLERETASSARLRVELEGRLATLGLQYDNEIAELERAIVTTDLEIAENDARSAVVVTATQSGTVTGIVAKMGQPVERGALLAAIVPAGAVLVAELYAPSRAVGFVAPGDEVRLRYAAYPYQKFGHSRGTVTALSQTTLGAPSVGPAPSPARGEPLYRVVVALESQTVNAYGAPHRLLPGMAVEADVLLETRRLYEWAFEPLFALARRAGS